MASALKKSALLCPAALLCLALLFGCAEKKKDAPKQQRPPAPVIVAQAARQSVPVQLKAIGSVEPYNSVAIKSQINGQVARVHFREGQDVRKGDLLFTLDARPYEAALKQAEAVLSKDQAQAKFAREQAQRYAGLLRDGIVTQDQYDQLRASSDALEAVIAADRAAVENARVQLSYCFIRSPIDGRTGTIQVQAGNLVKANDVPVLVTINQITPVFVSFSLPEREMGGVRKHMAGGRLKVDAGLANGGPPETGNITFMENTVDPATGMIKLKGTFANKERRLWPGQFADISLTLAILQNVVVVPTAAVQIGQQGQFVYLVQADGKAELRPVQAGIAHGGLTVIDKGLQAGDTVVTEGQARLAPGAPVEVKKAGAGESKAVAGENRSGTAVKSVGTGDSKPAAPVAGNKP